MLRALSPNRQQRLLVRLMDINHLEEVRPNGSRKDYQYFYKRVKSDLDFVTRFHNQLQRKWFKSEKDDWAQHFAYRIMAQYEAMLEVVTEQLNELGIPLPPDDVG